MGQDEEEYDMGRMHNPPHPGEMLREDILPALGLNVTQAAAQLGVTRAKASFLAVLARAGYQGERIVIKKGSRPTAVILGYDDYQRLVVLEDRYESALLTKSLKDDRFLTLDDVTKRLGL